jgi:hypothetical protein
MRIKQLEYSYNCSRGHTKRSVELKDESASAAAVLRKTAIQFTRFASLYHSIAGASHCCVGQPIVLLVTTMLSAIAPGVRKRAIRGVAFPLLRASLRRTQSYSKRAPGP